MGARNFLLKLLGGGAQSYADYIQSLAPILWLRLRETSGTNAVNSGSEGATLDGTIGGCTLGQTGQLGANEAFDFDGVDDSIQVTNDASINALTTQRWAFLVNARTLGAGSFGTFFSFGAAGVDAKFLIFTSGDKLQATISTSGTNPAAVSNASQVDFLGSWAWVFMDYDDADDLGGGRKIRLWKGVSGAVTALTLATDTAGTGTVSTATLDLFFGARQATQDEFDGLMDEVFCSADLWTTAEMQQIVDLSGV